MLKTRLWMGSLLILLGALLFFEERWLAPAFPLWGLVFGAAGLLGMRELCDMVSADIRPRRDYCTAALGIILMANWWHPIGDSTSVWNVIFGTFVAVAIGAFLLEMALFSGVSGGTVPRVGLAVLFLFYLGILPSFMLQLRWLPDASGELPSRSSWAILLLLAVPKSGDIGAYFTGKFLAGRLLGLHRMTPLLSPKKTWEGAAGGLLTSVAVAIIIVTESGLLNGSALRAVGFGLSVGIAGMLGDLAESLIKRDFQTKDASQTLPGFGGVLDVIDSLLFAGPVAYLWLR